uniref:Uncharacterized protein n=1 Tax=Utricularia reniformis TaxID=192314 RepID=A0A1Y0B0Z9_9LAMI|nr:hypothetical protein AEK19_MT0788 [Utricularia reniformis]ART31029.1 hypothetical protein AEK19_MT0788 [Utricularia reniformis]
MDGAINIALTLFPFIDPGPTIVLFCYHASRLSILSDCIGLRVPTIQQGWMQFIGRSPREVNMSLLQRKDMANRGWNPCRPLQGRGSVSLNHPKTTSATSFYHSPVSVSFNAGIPRFISLKEMITVEPIVSTRNSFSAACSVFSLRLLYSF